MKASMGEEYGAALFALRPIGPNRLGKYHNIFSLLYSYIALALLFYYSEHLLATDCWLNS